MAPALRTITEHVERVLALVAPLPAVAAGLAELADGPPAVLAQDAVAADAVPPFDNSAMDGYAVRLADLRLSGEPVTLRVTGEIPAAAGSGARLGPGEAVRIMTGAPLPPGADAVVPVERTSTGRFVAGASADETTVTLARQARLHVRRRGEDVEPGTVLGRAGTEATATVVAALAASGLATVRVHRRPRVAVIATGSELVPAGMPRSPGQITDSNSLMLAAAARTTGGDVLRLGPVPDSADALRAALDRAVEAGADLIVTAGGVSAGAADVVREVLALGQDADVSDVDVAGVGMQPGRPQALARLRGVPWIAVPGNPVSAYVSFALFVRPAIARLRGLDAAGLVFEHRRAAAGWTSPPGREQVLPVQVLPTGEVEPALVASGGSGGHLVSALAGSDGLAVVAADVEKVEPGDVVRVLLHGASRG